MLNKKNSKPMVGFKLQTSRSKVRDLENDTLDFSTTLEPNIFLKLLENKIFEAKKSQQNISLKLSNMPWNMLKNSNSFVRSLLQVLVAYCWAEKSDALAKVSIFFNCSDIYFTSIVVETLATCQPCETNKQTKRMSRKCHFVFKPINFLSLFAAR